MAKQWTKFLSLQTFCHKKITAEDLWEVAESGNLEMFKRLYFEEPAKLTIKDSRGRSAVHQAAARNRINILQFILSQGGDLNVQDNVGNTPLHVAVESDACIAVDYLLSVNVKNNILNDKKQAPIHLATELNKVSVIQAMMKHKDKIDVKQGGEHGRTALHIAAIYDHEECARILITELGACPRQPCNNGYYPIHEAAKNASSKTLEVFLQWGESTGCPNGYYPIHEAAKNASSKTLEVFLQWGESTGCPREEMIKFYDSEGNVPLHSAVHGGDIKAVELCLKSGAKISTQQIDLSTPVHLACSQGATDISLKSGAKISTQQIDLSTPVHLACSQGATDIIKLMFKMQPEEIQTCLASCDAQKMTPLHCAAHRYTALLCSIILKS
ncbi:Ankyrin repeats (3 copies) [Popillia japonica]|uniref:Ankyrin repeats (3 copies) n=1 Tax=Popillia japonica TaxID=7064 RepID=A0AAW1ITB1_POPJA